MTRPAPESDVEQAKARLVLWSSGMKYPSMYGKPPHSNPADVDRLLSSYDRLTRFMELLEPDPEDREEALSDPEFWAADYRNAMSQLAAVEAIETRANKLATDNEWLRGLIVATDKPWGPGLDPIGDLLTEPRAIRESKPE